MHKLGRNDKSNRQGNETQNVDTQYSEPENTKIGTKDLRGNPKPRVSLDRTGPDQNRSGVGAYF